MTQNNPQLKEHMSDLGMPAAAAWLPDRRAAVKNTFKLPRALSYRRN